MLFVPVTSLWMSAVRVVGIALNLHAHDFGSQEIRATLDPEFEPFMYVDLGWLHKINLISTLYSQMRFSYMAITAAPTDLRFGPLSKGC